MAGFANTLLIPTQDLPPGQVSAIRNEIFKSLAQFAAIELKMPVGDLVVRDLRPVEDLVLYSTGTTPATINNWLFTTAATATTGFVTVTGDREMADQRYVALFGVKDLKDSHGPTAIVGATSCAVSPQAISLIKIIVGGSDKAIWDLCKCACYTNACAGISPSAVVIPPNALYNIQYYKTLPIASAPAYIVLEGVVVEPRGLVLSP